MNLQNVDCIKIHCLEKNFKREQKEAVSRHELILLKYVCIISAITKFLTIPCYLLLFSSYLLQLRRL